MANVVYFSVIELLCGFAPNFTTFLILARCLELAWRRVGCGRIAGDGGGAEAATWNFERTITERIPIGNSFWRLWRQRRFCRTGAGGRYFGSARFPHYLALYIRTKVDRIDGMEGKSRGTTGQVCENGGRDCKLFRIFWVLMTFIDVSVARHARFVRRIS